MRIRLAAGGEDFASFTANSADERSNAGHQVSLTDQLHSSPAARPLQVLNLKQVWEGFGLTKYLPESEFALEPLTKDAGFHRT